MAHLRLLRLVTLALSAAVAAGCGPVATTSLDSAPTPTPPTRPAEAPTSSAQPTVVPSVAPAAQRIADGFVRFASGSADVGEAPLADRVGLGLGPRVLETVPRSRLGDRAAWDVELDGYAAATGTANALAMVRDAQRSGRSLAVTTRPHAHCASPPMPVPSGHEADTLVAIQPAEEDIDSCLDWFSVDLFVRDDRIAAVTLSLWEP